MTNFVDYCKNVKNCFEFFTKISKIYVSGN